MADFKGTYDHFLALPKRRLPNDHPLVRALDRAHDLRKLELEFYWQRSTYSWALQGAAFAALALVFKDGTLAKPALLLPVTVFGAVTSFAARLTASGSKFWQENWEHHVDLLEDKVDGRLTQTVVVSKKIGFSVSKINQRLLTIFFFGWISIFALVAAVVVCPPVSKISPTAIPWIEVSLASVALILGLVTLGFQTVTGLRGREWSDGDEISDRRSGRRRASARKWSWRELFGLRGKHEGAWLIQRRRT